jgi:transposase
MTTSTTTPCANCLLLQQQVEELRAQVAALQLLVAQLQEQLAHARKDSSTSSKPPSSDIVQPPKPPPPQGQGRRRRGGQPGHLKHQRPLLPPEQLSGGSHPCRLDCCPDCGQTLQASEAPPRVVQQLDVPVVPVQATEYRSLPGWCPHCQRLHYAPLPTPVVRGGLLGPSLTTWVAYLKGACHASYSTIRKFLRDILHVAISRGQLAKVVHKVSQALEAPYQELLERLPNESRLNVDETGHKDQGEHWWTWCFRAPLYTLFKIDAHRSADVLLDVLGQEFNGVLGCDYFSAYRRYMRECGIVVQFCLAHFIRDVQFLTTLPDARDRRYGERLREALRALFGVIHRREALAEGTFRQQLRAARDAVLEQAAQDIPPTKHSQILAKRLAKHGQGYFEFVTTPDVEPTNNLAEQAIRFVVLDRYVTQGTRGEAGRHWSERIWTVIATCYQQGRSVFDYLQRAVAAWFGELASPSLLTEPQQ